MGLQDRNYMKKHDSCLNEFNQSLEKIPDKPNSFLKTIKSILGLFLLLLIMIAAFNISPNPDDTRTYNQKLLDMKRNVSKFPHFYFYI